MGFDMGFYPRGTVALLTENAHSGGMSGFLSQSCAMREE
jgi:hypothetical protein